MMGRVKMSELQSRRIIWRIMADASEIFGVSAAMIAGRCIKPVYSEARQWVYFEAYAQGIPMAQIGRAIDDRDHTTIMFGIEKERERRKAETVPVFKSIRANPQGFPQGYATFNQHIDFHSVLLQTERAGEVTTPQARP
jgi:hypothetical protein